MKHSGLLLLCTLLALAGCEREERHFQAEAHNASSDESSVRLSVNQPAVALGGNVRSAEKNISMYDDNAYAVNEGKRLYRWYNCSGCHFNGGGGIGPPLIKEAWIYGGEPPQLFDTLVKGRPNGMPTWGGRIPEYQMWQIVAYVRSMNQKQPVSATSPRMDTVEQKTTNIRNKVPGVTK